MTFDLLVLGGGIVGLATARELALRSPGARIGLLEKEAALARHQSGRNSGVVHSGIYYRPGSRKAELARRGNASIAALCRDRNLPFEQCGKLIVAASERELDRLRELERRAAANEIAAEWIEPDRIPHFEPHASGAAALHVPSAAITDYRRVCDALAAELRERGVDLITGAPVERIETGSGGKRITAGGRPFDAARLVACCGLQSDRVAPLDGLRPPIRIIPFRGDYWELARERRHLVRGLLYPLPDPDLPFLGVHLTRRVDGRVHAGPNATLSLGREGYSNRWIAPVRDVATTFAWRGFWLMLARHAGAAWSEIGRAASRRRFAQAGRALLPGLRERDLLPAEPGIRAQAVAADGSLVDDFLFARGENSLHVLNAPSPAATASLEIAKAIAGELEP